MEKQEAINELKYQEDMRGKGINYQVNNLVINEAIDALEKQIPKKPVKKNPICYEKTIDGQESYAYTHHCPACGFKVKRLEHHCECGQTLDWRESTEKGGTE